MKISEVDERSRKTEKRQSKLDAKQAVEGFNLRPYFPITSLTLLNDFISNSDGKFIEKKDEFFEYLNSVSNLDSDMDAFCAGLLKVLFSKDFIRTHRWPSNE